jgi:hypothetical protein
MYSSVGDALKKFKSTNSGEQNAGETQRFFILFLKAEYGGA